MTVDFALYAAEDVQTAIVAWLAPLRRTAFERTAGDPLPSCVVELIAGTESVGQSFSDPVVSVHTFCDKALGAPAARDECAKTHNRMLLLFDEHQITIGTRVVGIDYLEVTESPRWEYYSDNILRKVARYRLGLPYVPNI